MENGSHLNGIRRMALDRVDRSRKAHLYWLVIAAIWEGACLVTFLLLMDIHDRLHWLLLVSAGLIYGTLGFSLIALGAYTRSGVLRVLTAIELLDDAVGRDAPPVEPE